MKSEERKSLYPEPKVRSQRSSDGKALSPKAGPRNRTLRKIMRTWELYLFILPALGYFLIFHYYPMYGAQIAFKDYIPTLGIWGSPWVGFEHFERFFNAYYFWTLIRNTVGISLYTLAVGFPIPIILALALNELRLGWYKRTVQTVTYAPFFIPVVVMAGVIIAFLSPFTGIVNFFLQALGVEPIPFMTDPAWFKTVFVFSEVWQNAGWGAVIYIAALAGVDPEQHEAAILDGASRLQRIWYINIPAIMPVMVILLILNAGSLLSVGFEKVLLLQNPLNLQSSEVIGTYVYRAGLLQGQFSFSTAVGLFNAVASFILLMLVNQAAKRRGATSLW